jgi:probable phosphoglycerate mutase
MTYLFLVRHARSTWNAEGRMQGQADPPLDTLGRRQAGAVGERLGRAGLKAIYSSPLTRARQTAEAIAGRAGLTVRYDDRLMERHLGEWTGLTGDEADEHSPELWSSGLWRLQGPPGGESYAQLTVRSGAVLEDILAAHPEQRVAVVSHGGLLSAYLIHLLGLKPDSPIHFPFANTAISRVRVEDGHIHLLSLGDDRHLDALRR